MFLPAMNLSRFIENILVWPKTTKLTLYQWYQKLTAGCIRSL